MSPHIRTVKTGSGLGNAAEGQLALPSLDAGLRFVTSADRPMHDGLRIAWSLSPEQGAAEYDEPWFPRFALRRPTADPPAAAGAQGPSR